MKVFLWHSTRDREFVRRLAAALGLRNTSAACSSILCVNPWFLDPVFYNDQVALLAELCGKVITAETMVKNHSLK